MTCKHPITMCDNIQCPCKCETCHKEIIAIFQRMIDDDKFAYVWAF